MKPERSASWPNGLGAGLLALALLLGGALPWAASAADAKPWSYGLSSELMSPYCPGRTLTDCPSPQAAELRDWIAAQEERGRSKQEVQEQLYARFGDVILQAPKARGLGLAAYVIPVVAFLAGGAVVVLFLRRQARATELVAEAPHGGPVDPDLEHLVDQELEQR